MIALKTIQIGVKTFVHDVAEGFFAITHNGLALVGLLVFCLITIISVRPDLQYSAETFLISWLQDRQNDASMATERTTAVRPTDLPKQQSNLAFWLSRKYKVGPEPVSALVAEAYESGPKAQIDPLLILAVMAIESSFNPFAQSSAGAQGLMQVMTKVHQDKYQNFGGQLAAFDPLSNIKVGVNVLRDCINRAGSTEGGLKLYLGSVDNSSSSYISRVMAEYNRLQRVAQGKSVPTTEPSASSVAAAGLENLWEKAQRLVNQGDKPSSEPDANK
jgi:Transglycosylase SLT domain